MYASIFVITHCGGAALQTWNSRPSSDNSACWYFARGALFPKPCLSHVLLVKGTSLQMRYCQWFVYVPAWPTQSNTTNAAFLPSRPPRPSIWESSQTSLGSPGNDNRYQVKRRWRITNANSQSDIWYVTSHASALSADEQSAIPEIRWWITPESFCIQPTQSARQPSPSLSPPLCCHHWASLCGRGRSQAYQGAPQYPWPIQLMINDKRKCHVAQHLVFNQSHMLTYSQILLPMISAVSFLSTNIWTSIMAALSAKSGRTKARSLSMFLWHSDWLGNK